MSAADRRPQTADSPRGYLTRQPIEGAERHEGAVDRRVGASVEFRGLVRGDEGGRPVAFLEYEAYEPMAERFIARLVDEANARWPLHEVFVRHRVGRVAAGGIAVLIAVRSTHRQEAFEACGFLIDAIKRDVPIWKRPDPRHSADAEGIPSHA